MLTVARANISMKSSIVESISLECNIRPPPRPSSLLPTSVQTYVQPPPTRLVQSPSKATRHEKPVPEIPVPNSWSIKQPSTSEINIDPPPNILPASTRPRLKCSPPPFTTPVQPPAKQHRQPLKKTGPKRIQNTCCQPATARCPNFLRPPTNSFQHPVNLRNVLRTSLDRTLFNVPPNSSADEVRLKSPVPKVLCPKEFIPTCRPIHLQPPPNIHPPPFEVLPASIHQPPSSLPPNNTVQHFGKTRVQKTWVQKTCWVTRDHLGSLGMMIHCHSGPHGSPPSRTPW